MNNLVKPLTWLLGVVFLVIGIAGFFVDGYLLGFEVGTVHNIVHILTGVVAVAAVLMSQAAARWFLIVFGAIYTIVAIAGFMTGSAFGLFSVNMADNYLHIVIGVVALAFGILGKGETDQVVKVQAEPQKCPKCGGDLEPGHVCPIPDQKEQPSEQSKEQSQESQETPSEQPAQPEKCPKCGGEMTEGHVCPAPEAPAKEDQNPEESNEPEKPQQDQSQEGESSEQQDKQQDEEEKPKS